MRGKSSSKRPQTEAEINEFKKDYASLSKRELIQKYKVSWPTLSRTWAYKFGASLKKDKSDIEEKEEIEVQIEYLPYPKFNIPVVTPDPKTRDEEDFVLVISDWHIGKITKSYNIEVVKRRLDKLIEGVVSIIKLHAPIGKIYIFSLGDMIQGENPYQGSKIDEIECGAQAQIYDHGVPIFSKLLLTLKQLVTEIHLYSVDGNHGRYDKIAPTATNWDRVLMKALKCALSKQEGVFVHPPEGVDSFRVVNIRGFRFFLTHGADVRMNGQSLPMMALSRKYNGWHDVVKGGFNYGYNGHFHTKSSDFFKSHAEFAICPTLVTDDPFGVAKFSRNTVPQQLCFGVHDKQGRTFKYDLNTDPACYPPKYTERCIYEYE